MSWVEDGVDVETYLTDDIRQHVCRPDGSLHRLYQALSPWPSAILPVHKFYEAILHAPDAPLDLHRAEFVATYVAILNQCDYARAHHGENYCATAVSRADAERQLEALDRDELDSETLSPHERVIASYTKKLTLSPQSMEPVDVEALASAGLTSAEIVHINQIAASFSYWTRMINGLGVTLGTEDIGLGESTLADIVEGQPNG